VPASERIGAGNQDRAVAVQRASWNPSSHSRDEYRQPIMGYTTDPWRASQARDRCRATRRYKVNGEGGNDRRPKGGRRSFVIMPSASRRWTSSWSHRRQIQWLGVTAHPTAKWISRQLTEAYGWKVAPRCIIRDHDAVYGDVFIRRLRAIGILDRPTAPRSPWQNGYGERAIGSIRRECLDHVVMFSERHLRHLLRS
jgi:hypothetical protein